MARFLLLDKLVSYVTSKTLKLPMTSMKGPSCLSVDTRISFIRTLIALLLETNLTDTRNSVEMGTKTRSYKELVSFPHSYRFHNNFAR